MKRFVKALKESWKRQINYKELGIIFLVGFVGILFVLNNLAKRPLGLPLFLETLGMDLVLIILFASTKLYGEFLDHYYNNFKKKK